jgi:cytochrome c-type biogenesis protein CcmE
VELTELQSPDPGAGDDPESADAGEAPSGRAVVVRQRGGLRSRRRQIIVFAVIAAALVILAFQGLGNATVFFKTADEAVAQKAKLGTHRFRIEGTVQNDVHLVGQNVAFTIANNGVTVPVVHHGDPPQLFKPGIPVVLEGRFEGGTYASDRIMVKHTADYVAQHPDRVQTSETSIPTSPSSAP